MGCFNLTVLLLAAIVAVRFTMFLRYITLYALCLTLISLTYHCRCLWNLCSMELLRKGFVALSLRIVRV